MAIHYPLNVTIEIAFMRNKLRFNPNSKELMLTKIRIKAYSRNINSKLSKITHTQREVQLQNLPPQLCQIEKFHQSYIMLLPHRKVCVKSATMNLFRIILITRSTSTKVNKTKDSTRFKWQ